MKRGKGRLAALLAVLMLLSMLPAQVWALEPGEVPYAVEGGNIYVDTNYGYVTHSDETVTRAVIPAQVNGTAVTCIRPGAFLGCSLLTEVVISEGVTQIGYEVFGGCTALTKIVIPSTVTEIGRMPYLNLESIQVAEENPVYTTIDGCLYTKNGEKLMRYAGSREKTDYTIPERTAAIGMYAFSGCSTLTELVIPSSVTSIEYAAFSGCESLTDVYYGGSEEEWGNIEIGFLNDSLRNANIHYGGTQSQVAYPVEGGNIYFDPATGTVTGCDETVTRAVIPAQIGGVAVTGIGAEAFMECQLLTEVVIPEGVTSIGDRAFYQCWDLASIQFPETLTAIGDYSLHVCPSLESVELPQNLASIGAYAFSYCTSLRSIVVPKGVTEIREGTFDHCPAVETVELPDGLKTIGDQAFHFCLMTSIQIPGSVTSIGTGAFSSCMSLEDVYFGGSEAVWSKVIVGEDNEDLLDATIHYAEDEGYLLTFTFPENLCTVTATDNDTGTVYHSGDRAPENAWLAYQITEIAEGYRIKSVRMNDSDRTEGFVNGGYGFLAMTLREDTTLQVEVEPIPEVLPEIDQVVLYTDYDCTQRAEAYMNYTADSKSARLYGKATYKDGVEYPVYYSAGQWEYTTDGVNWYPTASWGSNRFDFWPGWPWHRELDFLNDSYDIRLCAQPKDLYTAGPNVYSNVIHINGGADSEVTYSVEGGSIYFDCVTGTVTGCDETVTRAEIPAQIGGVAVTGIGDEAFFMCEGLKEVRLPDGLTTIGEHAFWMCRELTSVEIPDSVTKIGKGAFENCIALPEIVLPKGLTVMEEAVLSCCRSLTDVQLPEGLTTIGKDAFHGCESLVTVQIPKTVTKIGEQAFYTCTALASLELPEGLTAIAERIFGWCEALTKLVIPEGVTEVKDSAFLWCVGLKEINIPKSVTVVEQSAFRECIGLTDVYYGGNQTDWKEIEVGSDNKPLVSATIHYGEEKSEPTPVEIATEEGNTPEAVIAGVRKGQAVSVSLECDRALGSDTTAVGVIYDDNGRMLEFVRVPVDLNNRRDTATLLFKEYGKAVTLKILLTDGDWNPEMKHLTFGGKAELKK